MKGGKKLEHDAPNFTPRNFWASASAQHGCQRAQQSNQRRIATHEAIRDKTCATPCTICLDFLPHHGFCRLIKPSSLSDLGLYFA
jgi:hypothetical protein